MKINQEKITKEFELTSFGAKGWFHSKKLNCPACGEQQKFGIIFGDKGGGSYHCFKGKCGEHGTLVQLLKRINRTDLLEFSVDIDIREKLMPLIEEENLDLTLRTVNLPIGFRRILSDDYLEGRGWTEDDFDQNPVGITKLDSNLRGYLIFPIYEDGEVVGYLSRSKKKKEWHDENLKLVKQGKAKLQLRYQNSENTDFEKLLGGIDEVEEGDTVILVEGLMDKIGTVHYIEESGLKQTKCCYTFGTNVTAYHIAKLLLKGVKKVILMYDYETIKKVQEFGLKLNKVIETWIAEIKEPDMDPGNMFSEDFEMILSNLKSPFSYKMNRLPETSLRI